ncbi:PAS domain-containing protein [Spirosoma terrae]|uniref:histidine kinase n=1 Tax=Spirosoma terrae TaxID=1968276 RepID=A0A6L9LBN7_9BACT|nr:PAS domain-containing protein [Spirosoma terrae]NDU96223.1 PAS domain-containing protein [Spirosoma terrae]
MPASHLGPYSFLQGGGEMGELTRLYDWSKTAVGSPAYWSQSLRTLINMMLTSRFPMLIFWGPELITFYNDAFRPSLGNNGKHPSSLGQRGEESWAESWPVIGPMIHTIMAGGEAVWFEDQKLPIYRDGEMSFAYWTYSFSPLTDDTGSVNGILVTCTETTQSVLSREKAEEAQQQVLAFFEQSPVAVAIIDRDDLVFRMANPFYGFLVGRKPDDLVGKSLLDALPELAGQGFDQLLNQVVNTGTAYIANEVAVDLVRNNKLETIYVDLTYQPRRDTNNHIVGILVVATDVTQQVLARKKIEESEARFRSLITQAPVATGLFIGREHIIAEANEPMINFWGKGANVVGKTVAELLPELQTQPFLQILDEVYTSGVAYHATSDRCDLVIDGQLQTFYFNFTYQPVFNEQGEVYGILNMAIDVTSEMVIQQQLRESEESLRGAIELAALGTWSVDLATRMVQLSDRHLDLLGLDEPEISLQNLSRLVANQDHERLKKAFLDAQLLGSAGKFDAEYSIINAKTGKRKIVHALGKVHFNHDGNPVRIAGTVQDVTMQRELQLELESQVQFRTEELAATNEELAATNEELAATNEELTESTSLLIRSNENLQTFAYIASHDLQEPLRKIQQFGDLLKTQLADANAEQLNYLDRMQSAASRMSMLIRDLLNFSRISTRREPNRRLSLDDVMDSVLTDLELVITETGAQIDIDKLPIVSGDPSQLGQLFQNLLSNALKFSRVDSVGNPTAPRVEIRCQLTKADFLPLSVRPGRLSAHYYRIDMTDNGIGFDEKYVDRIFQVFQRLHGRNEFAGTGIGLAICEKVVANHGGAITATSQPGKGATFTVYLPA